MLIITCLIAPALAVLQQWSPQSGDPVVLVRVQDEAGRAVIGAAVHVEAEPRWGGDGKSYEFLPARHDPVTDQDGRFRFDPSEGVQYWIGIQPAKEPMLLFAFDRDALQRADGVVLRLRLTHHLRGRLLAPDGKPVAGRTVHLIPSWLPPTFLASLLPAGSILMECEDVGYSVAMNGSNGHPFDRIVQTTTTDEQGHFTFRARGGKYAVAAFDEHDVMQTEYRDLDEPEEEMDFKFRQLQEGSCQVLDMNEEPIEGALVYVARGSGWGDHSVLCPVGVTDDQGVSRYLSLAGDQSGLAVRHPAYPRWQVDDFHSERFEPGEPIILPPPTELSILRLPVRDLQGVPVVAPRFRTLLPESTLPGFTPSGMEPELQTIQGKAIAPGVYELRVDASAFIVVDSADHAPAAVMPLEAEADEEEMAASLHAGRRYSLHVTEKGVPVKGAMITLELRHDRNDDETHEPCEMAMYVIGISPLTDADGRWESPICCAALKFDFHIQHWDGRTEIALLPGTDLLEVEFGGALTTISGRLVQDGVPLTGCELVISENWNDETATHIRVPVGPNGQFSAKVHPGVPLTLAVDDQPSGRTAWTPVATSRHAGDLGVVEVNDHLRPPVTQKARVSVQFPTSSDGMRPSINLECEPSDPEDIEACGERVYWELFVNDSGHSAASLPAGSLTIRLDWPGRTFRVPSADYVTNAYSALRRTLILKPGQSLDLTDTVEEMLAALEALKVD